MKLILSCDNCQHSITNNKECFNCKQTEQYCVSGKCHRDRICGKCVQYSNHLALEMPTFSAFYKTAKTVTITWRQCRVRDTDSVVK